MLKICCRTYSLFIAPKNGFLPLALFQWNTICTNLNLDLDKTFDITLFWYDGSAELRVNSFFLSTVFDMITFIIIYYRNDIFPYSD